MKIKNNPNDLLQKEGIAKNLLSKAGKEALKDFDDSVKELMEFEDDKAMMDIVEKMGEATIDLLTDDIARIKEELKDDATEKEKRQVKKAQSKRIVEKAEKTMDHLAQCRRMLKEERQKKIETGEIKKPVKKKLTTKLKDSMKRIVNMMPNAIKEDKAKIDQTEKAITKFLNELKKIWGMNKIKPIEDELKEKFDDLKVKADKKEGIHTLSDGFQWKLVNKSEAKKLFEENKEVYGLDLQQETEALIESVEDLNNFDDFGIDYKKNK